MGFIVDSCNLEYSGTSAWVGQVVAPNNKKQNLPSRLVGFYTCEASITSNDITDAFPGSVIVPVAGAVGMARATQVMSGAAREALHKFCIRGLPD
jgi:hypothetical protein